MVLAIIIVVAVLIIAAIVLLSRRWQTLASGSGRAAEEVQAKYAYLQENQVKCRLKNEEAPTMGAVQNGGAFDASSVRVRLDVLRKDAERASELLKSFRGEQAF